MRKLTVLVCLVLLSICAAAQAPQTEIFGGYSYLRTNGGNLHGFDTAVTFNLNDWAGFTSEVNGQYARESASVGGVNASAKTNMYNVLFGPTVSHRKSDRFVPFARALFGFSRISAEGTSSLFGQSFSVSGSDTGLGVALGGGVDVAVTDTVSIRPVQMDYLLTRVGGGHVNSFRYAAGLVFRVGRRESTRK